jgi:glutaredoxin
MQVKVFSMEGCAGCVVVKNMLGSMGVPFEECDAFGEDAIQYQVRTLPTTFVNGVCVTGSQPGNLEMIKRLVKEAECE